MSIRRFAMTCGPMAGFALALSLSTAASAQSGADAALGAGMPAIPAPHAMPAAPSLPGAADMRPAWHGAASPIMPDARTRDAWLNECHRRTAVYYGGYRKGRHHRDESRRNDSAYSYCEAYFDDYYRTYAHHSHGQVHGHAMQMVHAPIARPANPPCVETVTTEYEPVRTRYIPRRPAPRRVVPDKRVRDKRMLMD